MCDTQEFLDVKTLISDGNGVGTIVLDNLTGAYQSQNPYAYLENAKSVFKRLKSFFGF